MLVAIWRKRWKSREIRIEIKLQRKSIEDLLVHRLNVILIMNEWWGRLVGNRIRMR